MRDEDESETEIDIDLCRTGNLVLANRWRISVNNDRIKLWELSFMNLNPRLRVQSDQTGTLMIQGHTRKASL